MEIDKKAFIDGLHYLYAISRNTIKEIEKQNYGNAKVSATDVSEVIINMVTEFKKKE